MNNHTASTSKMPDLNRRDGARQTVPVEAEFEPPPSYEDSGSASAAGVPTPATTSTTGGPHSQFAPSSPTASSHSSLDGSPNTGLLASSNKDARRGRCGRSPVAPGSAGRPDTGYAPSRHMTIEGVNEDDEAKWEAMRDTPGCCFSDSGGAWCSSRGGCCFSDRGGCCFSDTGGCCFSDTGGCCFSDTAGCCFSSRDAACCSKGPERRRPGRG